MDFDRKRADSNSVFSLQFLSHPCREPLDCQKPRKAERRRFLPWLFLQDLQDSVVKEETERDKRGK